MNILIIEDHKTLSRGIARALNVRGIDTRVIGGIKEYRDFNLSDEIVDYSVVILDIMIPNFSLEDGVEKLDLKAGWDVGEYIYDEINTVSKGQMPILVLSGKDAKELNISIQGDNSIYIKKASSGDFPRDAILDALTTLTGFEIKKNFV